MQGRLHSGFDKRLGHPGCLRVVHGLCGDLGHGMQGITAKSTDTDTVMFLCMYSMDVQCTVWQ